MTGHPFPEIQTRVELDAAPAARFVECVHCIDHKLLTDESDPLEWADEHASKRPEHVRYRVVSQTNFRVVPTAVEEICGERKTFPDDAHWRQMVPDWIGLTVTCDDAPHTCAPGEVVHTACVIVDGKYEGVHYWGPGFVPESLLPNP